MKMAVRRPYRMLARADAAAETGHRILDAALEAFWARPSDQISLEDVASRAGVTPQTIIRRFGGREGLWAAAAQRQYEKVRDQRLQAPVGDVPGAVGVLVDHYEELGDKVLKLLAEDGRSDRLHKIADRGRAFHREWCEQVFASALHQRKGANRDRLLAQLVAVCDVYTWKLLRRQAGLSRRQTELALAELLRSLVG